MAPREPIDFRRATVLELLQLLKSPRTSDRLDSIQELGRREIRSAWRPLRSMLRDRSWVVRCEAADVLGCIEATEAIPDLRRALKTSNATLKGYVSGVLAVLGDRESLPAFERMRKSKSERVRIHGAAALYILGDRQQLAEIIDVLTSEHYRNQCVAANILRAITAPDDAPRAIAGLRVAIRVERNPARVADFRSAIRELKLR